MANLPTRTIFCAKDQEETTHLLQVDPINGEILATCTTPDCGRFLKFPSSVSEDQFSELVDRHKESNEGQVSLAAAEDLVARLSDGSAIPEAAAEQPADKPSGEDPGDLVG